MDLIDREELLKDWNKKLNRLIPDEDGLHSISLETVIKALGDAPTVNAEPVRHGHWIEEKKHFEDDWGNYNYTWYLCGECGNKEKRNENYCPNCGAKMW